MGPVSHSEVFRNLVSWSSELLHTVFRWFAFSLIRVILTQCVKSTIYHSGLGTWTNR